MAGEVINVCAVPDFLGAGGQCQWEKNHLTYSVTSSLAGLADSAWLDAIRQAWSYWEAVCNIKAEYTDNAAAADVLIQTGRIDGPAGVLAWSEMPCGSQDPDQLEQRYDTGERQWVVAENPGQGQLDIVRVLAHEIGHVIGIPHFSPGTGAPALLDSMYNPRIRRPQPRDIQAAQGRYGPPLAVPVPPTTPPPVPVPPVPTPVPNPGGNVMNWLAMLQALLALLAKLFPPTPAAPGAPASPGTIIDWIRKILTAFGAGATITSDNLDAAYQTLQLPEVTEAQMNAPIQAMMME